jgi:hypothetical protein
MDPGQHHTLPALGSVRPASNCGGFARAVRAQHAKHLALLNQFQRLYGCDVPVVLVRPWVSITIVRLGSH